MAGIAAVNDSHLQVILEHLNPPTTLMRDIIKKARSAKTRLAIINHANTTEALYGSIAAMPDLSGDELQRLLSKTSDPQTLRDIWLAILADSTKSAFYKTALDYLIGKSSQNERLIQLIDTQVLSQGALRTILDKYHLTSDLMNKIAAKATEASTFTRLIQAAAELVDDTMLVSILDRKDVIYDNELLLLIANRARGDAVLQKIVEVMNTESVLALMQKDPKFSQDLFDTILKQAKDPQTALA